jgi:hypothetical protein
MVPHSSDAQTVESRRGWRKSLSSFFYAEETPYGMALLRICVPLALLVAMGPRWFHARELYSTDGAPAPLWISFGWPDLLPEPSGVVAVALCALLIVSLVTTSLGWMTRISALIACVLTAYIGMLDMVSTLTKYTVFVTHLLLLLSVSSAGDVWSVDAWLRGRRSALPGETGGGHLRSPVWPRRLVQLLIGIVYFAAACTKMQTPLFFSGDQMRFWLLSNINMDNPVGDYLTLYPPLLVMMGLVTIVWEMLFLFVCWGRARGVMLAIGALFHVMTYFTLGLLVFPLICVSAYWSFLTEADVQRVARSLRRWSRQRESVARLRSTLSRWTLPKPTSFTPAAGASAWALLLAATVLLGVEIEHRRDVYGEQRAAGPHVLKAMDSEVAKAMLSGTEPLRPEDKLLSFDVGSETLGGMLANRRSAFEQGDSAIIQCAVVPPHEDMWIEVNLHDEADRLLFRTGQVLTREKVRTHFVYPLAASLVPGKYAFVLRLNGREVSRRDFELKPGAKPTPSAFATTALAD